MNVIKLLKEILMELDKNMESQVKLVNKLKQILKDAEPDEKEEIVNDPVIAAITDNIDTNASKIKKEMAEEIR